MGEQFKIETELLCFGKDKEMGIKQYSGNTEQAGGAILSAAFWIKGRMLKGRVARSFSTSNGKCYVIELEKEITVDGEVLSPSQPKKVTSDRFSIGGLKGFSMALQAAGIDELQTGDLIEVISTGKTDTGKGNPQINFAVKVSREEF